MAHRIVLDPTTPTRFLSCGEDGKVFAFDTRTAAKRLLFQVKRGSIHSHLYTKAAAAATAAAKQVNGLAR
jgi:hypothetical protein